MEREILLPTPIRANIFSVPLEDLMGYDGEKDGIPRVIKDSIQYLRETGACLPSFLSLDRVTFNASQVSKRRDCSGGHQTLHYSTKWRMPTIGVRRVNRFDYVMLNSQNHPASGHVVSLDTFNDPNLPAVLIKKFLRDLPTPIFPERMYPVIQRCPIPSDESGDDSTITYIRETILPELPRCSYILLSHILRE